MVKPYPYLTQKILKDFLFDNYILRLLVDVEHGNVYCLPNGMLDIDFVAEILHVKKQLLLANPEIASFVVPSILEIENNIVIGITTGASSLEIDKPFVRHAEKILNLAHDLVHRFVEEGTVPYDLKRDRPMYKFTRKGKEQSQSLHP